MGRSTARSPAGVALEARTQAVKTTLKQMGPLLRADDVNTLLQTLDENRNLIYGEFLHVFTKRLVRRDLVGRLCGAAWGAHRTAVTTGRGRVARAVHRSSTTRTR